MFLEEAFERICVLNLPYREDRRLALTEHLLECGLIGDASALTWPRTIIGDLAPPPAWWQQGNGAWGCLRSHVRAAEDALHDGLAHYLVLEDDVLFLPGAAQMLGLVMAELPEDWHQLYLGGQCLNDLGQPPRPVDGCQVLRRPWNVNRTHAFALRREIIPRFLQHVQHAPDYLSNFEVRSGNPHWRGNGRHIDHQLGQAHQRRDWNTYIPNWWLCGQRGGSSNISGKVNPDKFWFWRGHAPNLPVVIVSEEDAAHLENAPLHFGKNPVRGRPGVDVGWLTGDPRTFPSLLNTLAEEALEFGHLPAVVEIPELAGAAWSWWPGGTAGPADIPDLWPYPAPA